jgi:hypothetical protein
VFDRAFLGDRSVMRRDLPVWVNLAVAFGQFGDPGAFPTLLDLSSIVPGQLIAWQRTRTGQWVGWCTVRLVREPGSLLDVQRRHVTVIVPAHAVTRREVTGDVDRG